MTSVRQKMVAVLVGLAAAVLLMEIALRLLGLGFGSSPMEPDPFLHHVHPKNYTFRQQHPSRELGGFDTHYNAEGRVFAGPGAPAPVAAPCRIALMGDSFTEGGQVPYEASYAGLLDQAARGTCEVRNYGVRSYSPAIYLVQWTREVAWQHAGEEQRAIGGVIEEDPELNGSTPALIKELAARVKTPA